ncbi:unnamed protein product [Cuscuta campestris]|uniref:Trehalase n=1 Tax=Cuscuta campestris TaxID=132261 RepID=A0A484KWU6_9ASTE|nr:unnamed protein product [Cuscuta campestris]
MRCTLASKMVKLSLKQANSSHPLIAKSFIIVLATMAAMNSPLTTSICDDHGPVVKPEPLVSFLEKVQEAALRAYGPEGFDPKKYVDLGLKQPLSETEALFGRLNGSMTRAELEKFVSDRLVGPEHDLEYSEPADFVPEPEGFLPGVEEPEVRKWGLEIHSLWKKLSRKVGEAVRKNPELHTLLPLENPVIIPGSRFQEVYYWDSYWVIRGLLASKMYETAKGIVYNLLSLIEKYGFVLNGARAYYTNRSQPPLLSSMIIDIYNRTGDLKLAKTALPLLVKEHHFWNSGMHKVTIEDGQGVNHSLSRYHAMWNEPRPESSTIDKETASQVSSECEKKELYREIATIAESGWDFSSRFMRKESDLTTLCTTSVLPVDLNAFLLKMELDIAFLANVLGDKKLDETFIEAAKSRKDAINSIFWNKDIGQWLDYWLCSSSITSEGVYKWDSKHHNKKPFSSNFIPLWVESFHRDHETVKKTIKSFNKSGLLLPAGIAMTLTKTGQQWDYPNGWAPIQHMIVEGLVKSGLGEAKELANDIARRWLRTNYAVYRKTGAMYEKYDVEKCGEFGGGGEYISQTGFGWSNGVVLAFLEEFGWPKHQKMDC